MKKNFLIQIQVFTKQNNTDCCNKKMKKNFLIQIQVFSKQNNTDNCSINNFLVQIQVFLSRIILITLAFATNE